MQAGASSLAAGLAQSLGSFETVRETLARVGGAHAGDDIGEGLGHTRMLLVEAGDLAAQNELPDRVLAFALKEALCREHLPKDDASRELVAARADLAARDDLRRHVANFADDEALDEPAVEVG